MKRRLTRSGILVLIGVLVCTIAFAKIQFDEKMGLTAEAKDALTKNYPDALIKEVEKEEEEFKVFEVELVLKDGQEIEVTLVPDGTVMEVENEISLGELPFDASNIIPKGAKVKEVEKEIIHAVLKPVALEQPKTIYALEIVINGQEVELEVAADGTILNREIEDEDDDDEGDDDDEDEDENEVEVSIDQVPEAVKTTIMKETQGGTIREIELENEKGKVIYEAEIMIDGQEIEIEVAADGTLLGREIEDDDDD